MLFEAVREFELLQPGAVKGVPLFVLLLLLLTPTCVFPSVSELEEFTLGLRATPPADDSPFAGTPGGLHMRGFTNRFSRSSSLRFALLMVFACRFSMLLH
jgi:hypothetical protein